MLPSEVLPPAWQAAHYGHTPLQGTHEALGRHNGAFCCLARCPWQPATCILLLILSDNIPKTHLWCVRGLLSVQLSQGM